MYDFSKTYYTLERDNRELQLAKGDPVRIRYYTLERDNRELQQTFLRFSSMPNYTLERDNRELQRKTGWIDYDEIIPLREIIGNYNATVNP